MKRHPLMGRPRRSGWIALVSVVSIVLLIAVFAASCGGGTSGGSTTTAGSKGAGAGGTPVTIKDLAFGPASVTVNVGESVIWTNLDSMNHTVTADNGEFKSSDLGKDATFTFKFDKAGTYAYHCSIHSSMTGTVIVK